ncbi:jg270 [Pararge aegeria aegeria]|uniref:Jg270 protein n=1 Tax=Pararge aegeria aegeria TaxID=348720 RepID=A0A8S4QCF7_9NEOP|nr:jg270 [Pararge aegeria aegeria]
MSRSQEETKSLKIADRIESHGVLIDRQQYGCYTCKSSSSSPTHYRPTKGHGASLRRVYPQSTALAKCTRRAVENIMYGSQSHWRYLKKPWSMHNTHSDQLHSHT